MHTCCLHAHPTPPPTHTNQNAHSAAAFADEHHGLAAGDYLQVLQLPGAAILAAMQRHVRTTPPTDPPTTTLVNPPSVVNTPVSIRGSGGPGSVARSPSTTAEGSLRSIRGGWGLSGGVSGGGGGVDGGGSVAGGRSVTSTAVSRWTAAVRARQVGVKRSQLVVLVVTLLC